MMMLAMITIMMIMRRVSKDNLSHEDFDDGDDDEDDDLDNGLVVNSSCPSYKWTLIGGMVKSVRIQFSIFFSRKCYLKCIISSPSGQTCHAKLSALLKFAHLMEPSWEPRSM